MTFSHRVTTRASFVAAVVALGLPVGQVAEARGDCARIGGVEGPIESFAYTFA